MSLNDVMEFDRVVRIDTDGSVGDQTGLHAPDLLDGEIEGSDWEFWSTGRSNQYSYRGPILHDSEVIGGGLERDLLASPGIYVAVVSWYGPDEDSEEMTTEGWAILRYTGND